MSELENGVSWNFFILLGEVSFQNNPLNIKIFLLFVLLLTCIIFYFIGVWLIYNNVLVSGIHHSDSV